MMMVKIQRANEIAHFASCLGDSRRLSGAAIQDLLVRSASRTVNRFAAELLMPFDMIMADLRERAIDAENEQNLKELAQRYQVSVQTIAHRITNLLGYF